MLKLTLIVIGCSLVLGCLAYLVSLCRPIRSRVSRVLRIEQTPEAIWEAITDHNEEPAWRECLRSITRLEDREGKELWEEIHENGRTLRLLDVDQIPMSKFVRRIVDHEQLTGTWTYELKGAPEGGVLLRITQEREDGTALASLLGGLVRSSSGSIQDYLEDLAAKFNMAPDIRA